MSNQPGRPRPQKFEKLPEYARFGGFFLTATSSPILTWKEGILTFRRHTDMTMTHKLARLPPRHGKTKA